MTLLRRLIAWIFYFGFLSAVGAGVFLFVRYRPRCTIVGIRLSIMHVSADGSRLVTVKQSKTKADQGPLRVWDTQTGEVVHELLGGVEVESQWVRWPDDRHFAVLVDDTLRLIDWRAGQEWRFEEPKGVQRFFMSPTGRWLFVYGAGAADPGGVIIDLKTRQISLRMDGLIRQFSRDDRWGFTRQGDKGPIDVWDLAAAKKITTIATDGPMLASPDGASLVTWSSEHKISRGASLRALQIWDLPSGRRRCRFEFSAAGFSSVHFSPNCRYLALRIDQEKTAKVVLFNAEAGQKIWETVTAPNSGEFSPDSALFLCWEGDKDQTFTMYEVATGQKLWVRHEAGLSITRFAGPSGNLFLQEQGTKPLLLLDARTGQTKDTGPLNFRTAYSFPFSLDGNHFVIHGWQLRNREPYFWETWLDKRWPELFGDDAKVTIVVESATGRELFRIRRAWMASMLSADASTLVTLNSTGGDEADIIYIWDVHPRRAWTWALSSVVATAVVCYGLSRLLRVLRNRKKTCGRANSFASDTVGNPPHSPPTDSLRK